MNDLRDFHINRFPLADDGEIPNNASFPLIHIRAPFSRAGAVSTPEEALRVFDGNGWGGGWVNGIYPFHHYHARSHEVLANLGDTVDVQFGGRSGPVVAFEPGDVVLIPAGCGHCRIGEVARLIVVGAYPRGQEDWDLKRIGEADYLQAQTEIPNVPMPQTDPLGGQAGPVFDYWLGPS